MTPFPASDLERLRLLVEREAPDLVAPLRAWIAEQGPADFVTARPRQGVEARLSSRWMPRHVWTLHACGAGTLAVRRRMLGDDDRHGWSVETPGGEMGIDLEELAETGHTRGFGSHRWNEQEGPPPIAGRWWGCDLSLDVYDHPPTAEERAAWIGRRRLEQALVKSPPTAVWVAFAGRAGRSGRVVKCEASRALGAVSGDVRRRDLQVKLPGYKPPRDWQRILHQITVDLYALAVDGEVKANGTDGAERVYLREPARGSLPLSDP